MRLILIRHGETEWNVQRRTQGVTDTPLTVRGQLQAQALSKAVKIKYNVDVIYSSPLQRAAQTALKIAQALNKEVILDPRLMEIQFGCWEGLTFSELAQNYPDEFKDWRQHPQNCKLVDAESTNDVMKRSMDFLQDMLQRHKEETVLVVSHTVFIKMLIIYALHFMPEHMHSFRLDNASLSILDFPQDRVEIRLLNDVGHLFEEEC